MVNDGEQGEKRKLGDGGAGRKSGTSGVDPHVSSGQSFLFLYRQEKGIVGDPGATEKQRHKLGLSALELHFLAQHQHWSKFCLHHELIVFLTWIIFSSPVLYNPTFILSLIQYVFRKTSFCSSPT